MKNKLILAGVLAAILPSAALAQPAEEKGAHALSGFQSLSRNALQRVGWRGFASTEAERPYGS